MRPNKFTPELIDLCAEFFRQATPVVHTVLDQFLTGHGHYGGLGWFLDTAAFTITNHSRPPPTKRDTLSHSMCHVDFRLTARR